MELVPLRGGIRGVPFLLSSDLVVDQITGANGAPLHFEREGGWLVAYTSAPLAEGEPLRLKVHFRGSLLDKLPRARLSLRAPNLWYPQVPDADGASYELICHYPSDRTLLAPGTLTKKAVEDARTMREEYVLDMPSPGVTFTLGDYNVERFEVGSVRVSLAVEIGARQDQDAIEEVAFALHDSLAYFSERLGPLPWSRLVVASPDSAISQAFQGFILLTDLAFYDLGWAEHVLGLTDRRAVVAHEVAHQWWGLQLYGASYRDQWLAEALANYAATVWARERLPRERLLQLLPMEDWPAKLLQPVDEGRPLVSVGPVVLGSRLDSSRSGGAYEAVTYYKGGVLFDSLDVAFGRDVFFQALRKVLRAATGRPITTQEFFTALAKATGADLEPFVQQYVYGTGVPRVVYDYEAVRSGKGWKVSIVAEQFPSFWYRFRIVPSPRGGWDVRRQAVAEFDVETSRMIVPVTILFDEGGKRKKKPSGPAGLRGNVLVSGPRSATEELARLALDRGDLDEAERWLASGKRLERRGAGVIVEDAYDAQRFRLALRRGGAAKVYEGLSKRAWDKDEWLGAELVAVLAAAAHMAGADEERRERAIREAALRGVDVSALLAAEESAVREARAAPLRSGSLKL